MMMIDDGDGNATGDAHDADGDHDDGDDALGHDNADCDE